MRINVWPDNMSQKKIVSELLARRLMCPEDTKLFAKTFSQKGGHAGCYFTLDGEKGLLQEVSCNNAGNMLYGVFPHSSLAFGETNSDLAPSGSFIVELVRALNNYDVPTPTTQLVVASRMLSRVKPWLLKNWFGNNMQADAERLAKSLTTSHLLPCGIDFVDGEMLVRVQVNNQTIMLPRRFLVPGLVMP